MTSEELERAIEFILAQQAKSSTDTEKLLESHRIAEHRLAKSEYRLDRYERLLGLMIRAGGRERSMRREQDEKYDRRYRELLDSQAHTDSRLDALIDIVRQQMNGGSG